MHFARAFCLKQIPKHQRNGSRAQAVIPARNLANKLIDPVHRLEVIIRRKLIRVARVFADAIELNVADGRGLQHDQAGRNLFFAP